MNQQNCTICDKGTFLINGDLYDLKETSTTSGTNLLVAVFILHKCKEAKNAPD